MRSLEVCRMCLRARRVRALEVNITVFQCRRVLGPDYVTSRGCWNRSKMQASYRATITLGFCATLKTCSNVLKSHRCFPGDQIARAMARAIWSSGHRRGSVICFRAGGAFQAPFQVRISAPWGVQIRRTARDNSNALSVHFRRAGD